MRPALWTGMFSRHCNTPEETVAELESCGFNVAELSEIELGKLLSSNNPEQKANAFRKFCDTSDLELSQAHLPRLLTPETATNPELVLEKMGQCFFLLGILGIPVAVIHPLTGDDNIQQNTVFFLRAVALSQKHGISLTVENLIGTRAETLRDLLKAVPGLGLNLDTAHASSSGWNIPEAIQQFGDRLWGVHLSDNNGEEFDLHLTPGKGKLDWEAILAALRHCGYSGDFHLELPHERGEDIETTRKAAREARMVVGEMLCR